MVYICVSSGIGTEEQTLESDLVLRSPSLVLRSFVLGLSTFDLERKTNASTLRVSRWPR